MKPFTAGIYGITILQNNFPVFKSQNSEGNLQNDTQMF